MKASACLRSLGALFAVIGTMIACSTSPQETVEEKPTVRELMFLTRQGCVNTVTMRANLDDALKALGLPNDYQFVDADGLAESDPRGGYGTPTVLHEGRDLFGMAEPAIPHPPPT